MFEVKNESQTTALARFDTLACAFTFCENRTTKCPRTNVRHDVDTCRIYRFNVLVSETGRLKDPLTHGKLSE